VVDALVRIEQSTSTRESANTGTLHSVKVTTAIEISRIVSFDSVA
jgi:hypothetical protein